MNATEEKHSCSLEQLYQKVSAVLSDNLSLFQGLTLCDISIDKKLTPHHQWQYSFYTGTTKKDKNNFSVSLKISNHIIHNYHKNNGTDIPHNASYDIVIESLTVSNFGAISITVGAISETGVSERELLRRRLEKFCRERGYLDREKKPLPKIITSILALTSKYSEIHDDLLSNININHEKVTVINCHSSKEISEQIRRVDPSKYSLVVLYRGGREDEAMNMFSDESIIESIVESTIPVCVALGHDMDTPFIYTVADQTYSTPSAFGKAVSIHNNMLKQDLLDTIRSIKSILESATERFYTRNMQYGESIGAVSIRLYEKVIFKVDKMAVSSHNHVAMIAHRMKNDLSLSYAINHHIQVLHKTKDTHINNLGINVKSYCEQILSQAKHNEIVEKGRQDKRKLYIVSGMVIVVLVVVILVLIFFPISLGI